MNLNDAQCKAKDSVFEKMSIDQPLLTTLQTVKSSLFLQRFIQYRVCRISFTVINRNIYYRLCCKAALKDSSVISQLQLTQCQFCSDKYCDYDFCFSQFPKRNVCNICPLVIYPENI